MRLHKGFQALVDAVRALVYVFPLLAQCSRVNAVHECTVFTGVYGVHGCMMCTIQNDGAQI